MNEKLLTLEAVAEGDKRSGFRLISSAEELWRLVDSMFRSDSGPDRQAALRMPLCNLLTGRMKRVKAAGGLVFNEGSELLFIRRFGLWDLPKGKVKKNESPETAAVREVEEETGLSGLQLIRPAGKTYHVFAKDRKYCVKETAWFEMRHEGRGLPVPQTLESITEVRWIPLPGVGEALCSSYRSLREFTSGYLEKKAAR